MPIICCSETFEQLTGYTNAEILGRNCRFLQTPPKGVSSHGSARLLEKDINVVARAELRDKIAKDEESQVQLVNYKKNGVAFVNLLTTIPISWDDEREKNRVRKRYVVGFQVDVERRV
jgi:PAS domain